MNLKDAVHSAIELAKAGSIIFPSLGTGAELAEKTLDIVEGLQAETDDDGDKENLDAAHKELYDAMTAKGHALSARLRG